MSNGIQDFAFIGNLTTGALIGSNGAIDWLCLPRFDSSSCFAAILGSDDNGSWRLRSSAPDARVRRQYRDGTLILETIYETAAGAASVIDFMPVADQHDRVDLVRIVQGLHGTVPMSTSVKFRFDYGRTLPWLRRREDGLRAIAGPNAVILRASVPLQNRDFTTVADFPIHAGETREFVLTWYPSHVTEPEPRAPMKLLTATERWWREWSGRTQCEGEWREAVKRSLITLKALTYAPTGGIVAAPTTSLPEVIGGMRNWDYRFCWLRDATMTLYALLISGYVEEARAWREWLLRAVAGQPQDLQIMYGIAGERDLTERELPWLSGYAGSRPVRVGNAAHAQLQLDVYGEVADALHVARRYGLESDDNAWRMQCLLMNFLESGWQQPDEGIWEIRGPRRQFTHSKVMTWVAVDRSIKAIERYGEIGPLERWRVLRDEIHRDVCAKGFNPARQAFVQFYGSDQLDASLLMMPLVGFLPLSDERVLNTVAAIERELVRDGLVMRYATESGVDGLPPGEGAFLACSFWLADNLALSGQYRKARHLFEHLLDLRNDVGLLGEQYDPVAQCQLGNFPQAFTHVALVNTAHNLKLSEGPAVHRSQR